MEVACVRLEAPATQFGVVARPPPPAICPHWYRVEYTPATVTPLLRR